MKGPSLVAGIGLLVVVNSLAGAQDGIRRVEVQFPQGASSVTQAGTIKGNQMVDYLVRAQSGQSMSVAFAPSNLSAYFNVLSPTSHEALFVGSTSGNRFEGTLPADGDYTIRVYLMRNAARRSESATYKLRIGVGSAAAKRAAVATTGVATGFDRSLELHGVQFRVTSANTDGANIVRIVPQGLAIDNTPIERRVSGVVTGAEIADLNVDRSPEVFVYACLTGRSCFMA